MEFVVDMTPLVDITFLLLTFLMFTAKFKSEAENEQKYTIERPRATPDTTKLPERDLAIVKVAIDDKTSDTVLLFGMTNPSDKNQVWDAVPEIKQALGDKNASLVQVDSNTLGKLIKATRSINKNTKFALDADKKVTFSTIWTAMNIMRKNNAFTFNYVTEPRKGPVEEEESH
jgi:biopolymer transport protein ExbD